MFLRQLRYINLLTYLLTYFLILQLVSTIISPNSSVTRDPSRQRLSLRHHEVIVREVALALILRVVATFNRLQHGLDKDLTKPLMTQSYCNIATPV